MTRHEPAGLPKAAVAETITGSAEPPGDVRVYGGRRPLTGGALGPRIPLSVHIGGLATVLSPLGLPLPLTLATKSLRPS